MGILIWTCRRCVYVRRTQSRGLRQVVFANQKWTSECEHNYKRKKFNLISQGNEKNAGRS